MRRSLVLLLSAWIWLACAEPPAPAPASRLSAELRSISPERVVAGEVFQLVVHGEGLLAGDQITIDGRAYETVWESRTRLSARVPGLRRGQREVAVLAEGTATPSLPLWVQNAPPQLNTEMYYEVDEEQELVITFGAPDFDGDRVWYGALDLPPGAVLDASSATLRFRPTFIQGGDRFVVTLIADDGLDRTMGRVEIAVRDTISPPAPEVTRTEVYSGYRRLFVSQVTDSYLDSPGHAGRSFQAVVTVPNSAQASNPAPVRVSLHGLGASSPRISGSSREFRIAPHDPDNTYWWGYSDQLPEIDPAVLARVPPYTARRVLHLLEWILRNFEGANGDRVYLSGSSMGGAGAATIGLLWARHFAWVSARLGQTIARNHRSVRIRSLSRWWGAPELMLEDEWGSAVWDRMDLTRALLDEAEARTQFIFLKHGKDDGVIHFGAVVDPSPVTGLSFYEVLQGESVGHYAIWDEGGHGSNDPVLGAAWWDNGWNPIFDDESFLRRNLAFPAFSSASSDLDPGNGMGNGIRERDPVSAYAGRVSVAGDTGWNGVVAGGLNRYLRWDAAAIVDDFEEFQVPLRVIDGDGEAPPGEGYPPIGNRFAGTSPVIVNVTIRRPQAFRPDPGAYIFWEFGARSGTIEVSPRGEAEVRDLPLTSTWQLLRLRRIR